MMDRYKLERELIRDEGWRSKPYKCTAGHWTIGVGKITVFPGVASAAQIEEAK